MGFRDEYMERRRKSRGGEEGFFFYIIGRLLTTLTNLGYNISQSVNFKKVEAHLERIFGACLGPRGVLEIF